RALSQDEKDTVGHVVGGMPLLDTVHSDSGMNQLRKDVRHPHQLAVLNFIQFMESIRAKRSSSICSTLIAKIYI
ncbi:ribonucleotide-diphosphate reductase subunit beta, partial [Enterococcus faecium]